MNFLRSLFERRNLARFKERYDAQTAVNFQGFGDLRREKFPKEDEAQCWLDRPDAEAAVAARLSAGTLSEEEAEACRFWIKNGYFVVDNLISSEEIDKAWAAYERALEAKTFGEPRVLDAERKLYDRTLDPHLKLPEVAALQAHPAILRWTDLFFGRKTIPFQTIIGHAGSQQAAHSDSIHMTTYPLGFLSAAWVAFEDIHADSGPLDYYPGSHKLPYILSADAGISEQEFKKRGYAIYHERYEPAIQAACNEAGLVRQVFLPKKGGVLFWHANLVHGGSPRLDPALSRKALVCHYFGERAVTYHDLSGNASRLHAQGMYEPAR